MYPFPLAAEILQEPLKIDSGDLILGDRPGLGVDVDERVIDRYPYISGPWSYFATEEPRETRAVSAEHSDKWSSNGK